jgi:hypothetical protein
MYKVTVSGMLVVVLVKQQKVADNLSARQYSGGLKVIMSLLDSNF